LIRKNQLYQLDADLNSTNQEKISMNFWGIKFDFTNPGKKTIPILIILLIFILGIIFFLKTYFLSFFILSKSKNAADTTITVIKKILKR